MINVIKMVNTNKQAKNKQIIFSSFFAVCVKVAYLLRDHGFLFSIFVNSYRVFHHEISCK